MPCLITGVGGWVGLRIPWLISPVFDCTFGEPDYESPKMRGLTKAESEGVGFIVQSARLALSMRFHVNLLHPLNQTNTVTSLNIPYFQPNYQLHYYSLFTTDPNPLQRITRIKLLRLNYAPSPVHPCLFAYFMLLYYFSLLACSLC